jgi:hypothetical protein
MMEMSTNITKFPRLFKVRNGGITGKLNNIFTSSASPFELVLKKFENVSFKTEGSPEVSVELTWTITAKERTKKFPEAGHVHIVQVTICWLGRGSQSSALSAP